MIRWYKTTQKAASLLQRSLVPKDMITKQIGQICNFNVGFTNYKYVDHTHYFDQKEMEKVLKRVKEKTLSGVSKQYHQEIKDKGKAFVYFTKDTTKKNLSKLSNKELLKLFRKWAEDYSYMWAFTWIGYFMITILTEEIINYLSKISKDWEENFIFLTTDTKENHISQRQKELLGIAIDIYQNKKMKKIFEKELFVIQKRLPREYFKRIHKIYLRYRWLGTMFLLGKSPEFKDFLQEIKLLIEKNPIKKLNELKQKKKEEMRRFYQTKNKLKITRLLLYLIKELQNASHQRTELLHYVLIGEYYSLAFLREIAKRFALDFDDFIYLTYDEVIEQLSKNQKVNQNLKNSIKARKEGYAFLLMKGKRQLLVGNEIKKIYEISEYDLEVKEIRGTIASSGKAEGNVKIVLNTADLHKVENGDILVAFMTTPDYIMAMQRAAAIVTNDGGITCHAAIISRELGIPCIVGTKIATKLLKEGELVEVDATKGIITKIQRE